MEFPTFYIYTPNVFMFLFCSLALYNCIFVLIKNVFSSENLHIMISDEDLYISKKMSLVLRHKLGKEKTLTYCTDGFVKLTDLVGRHVREWLRRWG